MAKLKQHRILIATDGSPAAVAALETATRFPWPESALVRAVIARTTWPLLDPEWLVNLAAVQDAMEMSYEPVSAEARRVLKTRWPNPKVMFIDDSPQIAILAAATRFKANLIVLGWRGHGQFRRLLAGSVSRGIAAHASCPVLVVREAPKTIRRFVLGFDGSVNARRAVDFLDSLEVKRGSSVLLVQVIQRDRVPSSAARFPLSIRTSIRRAVTELNAQRLARAEADLAEATARLVHSGWTMKGDVRIGDPLVNLLEAVREQNADVLIVGARATHGLDRALMGSVANGALDRSPVPVLIVR